MTISELNKLVERETGRTLTLDDLLKKQDRETWRQVLRRPAITQQGGVYDATDSQASRSTHDQRA